MIATKRESMASLIHDTSPYYDFVATFSFGRYHQAPGASCSILYILVLSLVIFMQSLYTLSKFFIYLSPFIFFTAFSSESYRT